MNLEIWITIRSENARQRSARHYGAGLGISAGVEIDLGLLRQQRAVFFYPGLELAFDRVAPAGRHSLGESLHDTNGPARLTRESDHQRFDFCA